MYYKTPCGAHNRYSFFPSFWCHPCFTLSFFLSNVTPIRGRMASPPTPTTEAWPGAGIYKMEVADEEAKGKMVAKTSEEVGSGKEERLGI